MLITGHQYPVGTALTNRIRSYLEVLAEEGHEVRVIVYRPSEARKNVQNEHYGSLNGVSYISSAHSVIKSKSPIAARFTWVFSYLNCLRLLYISNKKKHIDVIIQASSRSSIIPFVYLLTRLFNIMFVLENSEYPWFFLKKKISNLWNKPLYLGIYYKMFDGFLAMTTCLEKFHREHSKKTASVFHLPMTVDMKRFNIDISRENLITYVGNVSYNKDGVGILLDAYLSIADIFPDWKLMIIGKTSRDNEIKVRAEAANLGDRVILMGSIHRDEVPILLCKSKILALARPNSLQSEGGFPTKLGEYLATGNLVVVTSVGEIPDYLEDSISALIAKPGSVESFVDKLKQGIQNYDALKSVRAKGYEVCKSVFNAKVQAHHLSDFLIGLRGK
ncbi:MAG: glycosyltransferase family 4 protein [Candidatus Cloacimonetes bacterium]|nr:glycosyltransferase family 4 protein [Candidatus Cloacimonadota bacterium]